MDDKVSFGPRNVHTSMFCGSVTTPLVSAVDIQTPTVRSHAVQTRSSQIVRTMMPIHPVLTGGSTGIQNSLPLRQYGASLDSTVTPQYAQHFWQQQAKHTDADRALDQVLPQMVQHRQRSDLPEEPDNGRLTPGRRNDPRASDASRKPSRPMQCHDNVP